MYTKIDDIDERLTHIQAAVLNLSEDMKATDFHAVKGYIEAICRHRDKSVDTVDVPPIIVETLTQMLNSEVRG